MLWFTHGHVAFDCEYDRDEQVHVDERVLDVFDYFDRERIEQDQVEIPYSNQLNKSQIHTFLYLLNYRFEILS